MKNNKPKFNTGQVVAFLGINAWRGYGRVTFRWQEAVGSLTLRWRYNVTVPNNTVVDMAEKELRKLRLKERGEVL